MYRTFHHLFEGILMICKGIQGQSSCLGVLAQPTGRGGGEVRHLFCDLMNLGRYQDLTYYL